MLSKFYKKKLDLLLSECKRNLPANKINSNLISLAFKFALEAHKNDKRASGEPYFTHPYEVAMIIAKEIPLDDISVTAALLHDVIEDTKFTVKDVKAEFGEEVAEIVDGATKIESAFENFEWNQVESYKKMLLSMTSDLRVILVKFADRLHNLRTLEYLSNPKQIRLAQETIEIYSPFAHRFGLSNVKTELEDLSFKYLNKNEYEDIAKKLKEKKKGREKFIRKFVAPLKGKLDLGKFKYEIEGRAKNIYSINRKLEKTKKPFDEIYDLFAIRIILDTKNKNDCFSVYGICSEIYIPVPERFKDYISLPKQNGYQSIHTTLVSKEGRMVEVQIRTKEMHEVAEKGIAAHWKYKENTGVEDKKMEDWMKWIRETFENVSKEDNTSKQLIERLKLNLFADEIYCFTPKGELRVLPAGATPIDFAFEIHTEVGTKCIGAKVDGKIITLDTPLKSGNQVEIITSKNQKPKLDWEKFVVTHKAKSDIRRYFNSEKRRLIKLGREYFNKKIKKNKVHINEDSLQKIIHKLRFKDLNNFYHDSGQDTKNADNVIDILIDKTKMKLIEQSNPQPSKKKVEGDKKKISSFEKFIQDARESGSVISLGGENESEISGLKYDYAKCCNPIPGDEVVGFITQTQGIKIHRKSCKNIVNLFLMDPDRILEINWREAGSGEFTGGIKIIGEDKPGMLNDITKTISENFKINIKNINIYTKGSMFEGTLIINVENLKQLNAIIDKINKQEGVFSATRFEV